MKKIGIGLILLGLCFAIDVRNAPISSSNISTNLPTNVVTNSYNGTVSANLFIGKLAVGTNNVGSNSIYAQGVIRGFNVWADGTGGQSAFASNAGSVSNPAYSFGLIDISTGLYRPAQYQIGVAISGSEVARFTSQNVGIGTTAPSTKLEVAGTVSASALLVNGGGFTFIKPSNFPIFSVYNQAADEAFRFFPDGNSYMDLSGLLGIGTKVPTAKLTVSGSMQVSLGGSSVLLVSSNGNVGIGTSNPTEKLQVVGTINATRAVVVGTTTLTVPDYVFEKDYKLLSIKELDTYVRTHKHLPNVKDQTELKINVDLLALSFKLLEKVEESHLYIIELEKRISKLEKRIKQ